MLVKIRRATASDAAEILQLIRELAAFEREPDAVEVSLDELIKDGFSEHPLFQALIAETDEGAIAGMALYYPRYSTWKGKTLHLEDLIVKKSYRSSGIGTQLFEAFLKVVQQEKVRRAEWVVLDWNQNAIDFYEKSGAKILKDWHLVQIDQKAVLKRVSK